MGCPKSRQLTTNQRSVTQKSKDILDRVVSLKSRLGLSVANYSVEFQQSGNELLVQKISNFQSSKAVTM